MANLSEICEELFWIFFEEELCNFGVLQAARSAGWWHPAGQLADRLSGFKVLPQPLAHLYEWSLFSMDHCKKKIAKPSLVILCSKTPKQSSGGAASSSSRASNPLPRSSTTYPPGCRSPTEAPVRYLFLQNTIWNQSTKRGAFLPQRLLSPLHRGQQNRGDNQFVTNEPILLRYPLPEELHMPLNSWWTS